MKTYKQGIINTESHNVLRKGQVVYIVAEKQDSYIVKPLISCIEQIIKKEDLILN